jgi:hypothetical protein
MTKPLHRWTSAGKPRRFCPVPAGHWTTSDERANYLAISWLIGHVVVIVVIVVVIVGDPYPG